MYTFLQGKKVGQYLYQHIELAASIPIELNEALNDAISIASIEHTPDYNVIKVKDDGTSITLLDYDRFMDEGFPALKQYWAIDLENKICRYRSYQNSYNPPVLHRKELLLPKDHIRQPEFKSLTKAAESLGLFDDSSNIGFYQTWSELLKSKGFSVSGNELLPIGNDITEGDPVEATTPQVVSRHLTALTRSNFSAPMQILQRHGYFDRKKSIFDYGCGKGDDLRGLSESGINAQGWDPYYAPERQRINADIVNLGFVLNVIEDSKERADALTNAFGLADQLLVVSVMLKHLENGRGQSFNDGILTGRGTFQKYYTQEEIIAYIKLTLNEDPIPAAPGVILVFKDKDEEQTFLARRNMRRLHRRTFARRPFSRVPPEQKRHQKLNILYDSNRELLAPLWDQWVELGRAPDATEIDNISEIEGNFGSLRRALNLLANVKGDEGRIAIEESAIRRADDMKVYLARLQLQRRSQYKKLERGIRLDISAFFGTYVEAKNKARELLYQIADIEAVWSACREAAQAGTGWLNDDHSLQLHTSLIPELPALLRCYINCGTELYGDAESADLIKVHIKSGKLTLMEFDNFNGKVLPRMTSRIKVQLKTQSIQYFDYVDEYEPPYLYFKSRYINETFTSFERQKSFEEQLEKLCPEIAQGHGPTKDELDNLLARRRYFLDGDDLARSRTFPDLDAPCGNNLIYRDLVECGQTVEELRIPNTPRFAESYNALNDIACNVLDPIIDYFGAIKLTYGFCSHELSTKIKKNISPRQDQHCSFERNSLGKIICHKTGAAIDFLIEDESSIEVAEWIMSNIMFDKLYIYGELLPIHISYSNTNERKVYFVNRGKVTFPTKVKTAEHLKALAFVQSL